MGAVWSPMSRVSGTVSAFQAQLSRRCPSFVEDQAVHVVGEVGEGDLGFGALDADSADEQHHLVLLPVEHMFDTGTDLRFGGVGPGGASCHSLADNAPSIAGTKHLSHAWFARLR